MVENACVVITGVTKTVAEHNLGHVLKRDVKEHNTSF